MRRIAIAILLVGVLVSACTAADTSAESAPTDTEGADVSQGTTTAAPSSADEEDAVGGGSPQAALEGRKIIRQASLVVQDDDPESVFQRVVVLVEGAGGFVADSELQRTDDETPPRIDMTLRLPAGSLSAAIAAITTDVGEVLSRQLGSSDVTARYVDIEARLRNLESLESELLLLLTEVRDVADPEARDLLLVFDRLQSVRLEIEQLVGQRQAIDDQVDLATLRVTIVPTPPEIEITDDSWRPSEVLRESLALLVDVLENVADFAIWAGVFLLPVLALVAIPLGLLWWLVNRHPARRVIRPSSHTAVGGDDGASDDEPEQNPDVMVTAAEDPEDNG